MSGDAVQQVAGALPDIPRFYTALAEWLACVLCILEMKPRIRGWKLAAVSLGALGALCLLLVPTPGLTGILWILCMLGAIALMYAYMFLCCGAGWRDVAYYLCRAFAVAEFAASLEWQLDCYLRIHAGWDTPWVQALCLIGTYGAVYTLIWLLFRKSAAYEKPLHVQGKELVSSVIICTAIFIMSNLGFVTLSTPFSSRYGADVFNVRTITDLGGVAMLYAYHMQLWGLRVHMELESVELILQNQYQQYRQSQEAVEMINYKYHDLKHFIIALRTGEGNKAYGEMLDRMEADLSFYEAQNKTGSEVLDTLLTMKSLLCQKYHITMTSVVDGTLFSFMDVMDICAIFGNALDNAIECEKKVADREKRLIHVAAARQRGFLLMQFENYCDRDLSFQGELPVTTKKNRRFHGYGLKSLEHTVHKYDGEMDITLENDTFRLKVLVPLPQEKQ